MEPLWPNTVVARACEVHQHNLSSSGAVVVDMSLTCVRWKFVVKHNTRSSQLSGVARRIVVESLLWSMHSVVGSCTPAPRKASGFGAVVRPLQEEDRANGCRAAAMGGLRVRIPITAAAGFSCRCKRSRSRPGNLGVRHSVCRLCGVGWLSTQCVPERLTADGLTIG